MRKKLYVVGAGPGCREFLPPKAEAVLRSVDRVLGTPRVAELHENGKSLRLTDLIKRLEEPFFGTTAVLVGGDPGFFSAANRIVRDFSGLYDIELVGGIGSISYFCARIGTAYDDARLISLHGRSDRIVPYVSYNKKVFALTGGSSKPQNVCKNLSDSGLTDVNVIVGENLSYPNERIVRGSPPELQNESFDDLSIVFIENNNAAEPYVPLRDRDFIRSDDSSPRVPMTKEEIRWLVLAKLSPLPKDILYDIGAGTGSVAVEMARKAFEGTVFAVERRSDACELIEKNRVRHGAYNVFVKCGEAPDCLDGLPVPDKIFIGGSDGNMETIVKCAVERNPKIRIVANVVSPKSLNQILEAFERHGIFDADIMCVNVAKSKRVGRCDMMTAQNPVYVVTGQGGGPCD